MNGLSGTFGSGDTTIVIVPINRMIVEVEVKLRAGSGVFRSSELIQTFNLSENENF